jgi:hypothetical protein
MKPLSPRGCVRSHNVRRVGLIASLASAVAAPVAPALESGALPSFQASQLPPVGESREGIRTACPKPP